MTALERVKLIAQKCEDGEIEKEMVVFGKTHKYRRPHRLSRGDIQALRTLARQYERLIGAAPVAKAREAGCSNADPASPDGENMNKSHELHR